MGGLDGGVSGIFAVFRGYVDAVSGGLFAVMRLLIRRVYGMWFTRRGVRISGCFPLFPGWSALGVWCTYKVFSGFMKFLICAKGESYEGVRFGSLGVDF